MYLERARAQQLRDVPPLRRPLRLRRRADGEDRVLRRDAGAVYTLTDENSGGRLSARAVGWVGWHRVLNRWALEINVIISSQSIGK